MKTALKLLTLTALLLPPSAQAVVTSTAWGKISQISSGWYAPDLNIVMDTPVINPDNCPLTDQYILPHTLAGNEQMTAIALSAYSMDHKVLLTISGCYNQRPQIIGYHKKILTCCSRLKGQHVSF